MSRDPLGAAGDFTTAPEISQMFGELIGLWAVEAWAAMGKPRRLRLVELGPGRGTLMADLLRAARVRPAFFEVVEIELVETSLVLREKQREELAGAPVRITWRERLSEVPQVPAIVIANEFLDALPVRQFVLTGCGWCERLVGLAGNGELAFGLAPKPTPGLPQGTRLGDMLERPRIAMEIVREIAQRLVSSGGAALVIDYGYEGPAFADTLQAVKGHSYADPLAEPGTADLTAHVDFATMAAAAQAGGAAVHGPVPQGEFLRSLGIEARAARLKARATPSHAAEIDAALKRLTGRGPEGMGELFKAMCIAHPDLRSIPGFAPAQIPTEAFS
jgi:NADH dehydrogenase [ubiquinone] 1 alpha subcomplex assembly factor 7